MVPGSGKQHQNGAEAHGTGFFYNQKTNACSRRLLEALLPFVAGTPAPGSRGRWLGRQPRPPPSPPNLPPRLLAPFCDLGLLFSCFVVFHGLVLSLKCQGQCLIHAAPPTPLWHIKKDSKRTPGLESGLSLVVISVILFFTSFLPSVPRMAA